MTVTAEGSTTPTEITGEWTEKTGKYTAEFVIEQVSADVTLDIDLDTALAEEP